MIYFVYTHDASLARLYAGRINVNDELKDVSKDIAQSRPDALYVGNIKTANNPARTQLSLGNDHRRCYFTMLRGEMSNYTFRKKFPIVTPLTRGMKNEIVY